MGNKADDEKYERAQQAHAQIFQDGENLERIADSLERLVIAADQIATALSLRTLTPTTPAGFYCQNCSRVLCAKRGDICPDCRELLAKSTRGASGH